jgi:phosphoribosylformylglycinamidine (FGAM) synthase PurS component
MKSSVIEVYNKNSVPDVFGQEIKKNIESLGISGTDFVKVSQLYKFTGEGANPELLGEIARQVIIDPVSQSFAIKKKNKGKKGFFVVFVWYKQGVTDTVADTTLRTITDAGFSGQFTVSTGAKYYIRGDLKRQEIEEISERVLANSLIQDYAIF